MEFMNAARKFIRGLGLSSAHDKFAVRQLTELQAQVLSLYALIIVNAGALAFTHYPVAPAWLSVGVPLFILPICIVRAIQWWRLRPCDSTEVDAIQFLRRTSIVTTFLSCGFVGWGIALVH